MAVNTELIKIDLVEKDTWNAILESAGGGGDAASEWITIFGDLNEDGAPLDEIEVTAAGGPIALTSYTTKVPLIGQNVKLIIDDTEIDCEVLGTESQIGITNVDHSITIGFTSGGESVLVAQLEAGTHTVSCFIEKLNPDNILVIGAEKGTGTAQDPDTLYYGDTGDDLSYFDYLAFITQLVPLKIGLTMPTRTNVGIVNSWSSFITNQNQYQLLLGVGNYYYGLYAGGGQ